MAWFKTGGGGEKVATGTFTPSSSTSTKITLGFRPKFILIFATNSVSTKIFMTFYYETLSTSYTYQASRNANGNVTCSVNALPPSSSTNNRIASIDDDGFTFTKESSLLSGYGTPSYIAMG